MTISTILGERATSHPDRVFLRFAEGDLTFAATDAAVDGVACGLHAHGVRPGEPVAVLMPNCIDFVVTWFALSRLGAVSAPINTAFRGSVLVHILNLSKASVVVVDESLIGVLVAIAAELGFVTTVVVRGDAAAVAGRLPRWRVLAFTELAAAHGQVVRHVSADSDLALVLFTSGTTGRSKGCMLSHRYVVRQAELMIENLRLVDDDVLFCPFPLFHLDASVLTVVPALVLGTTAAISTRFSAAQFWPEVRASGATVFDFMGATLSILHNQPAASGDASNPVRLGWGVPLPEFTPEFEQRFGLRLVELYGSTDVGVPIYTPLDEPRRLGSCGRTIPAYETRLVDADDRDVPTGAVGEIVVRPREPSLIMDGYLGMPEETLRATRNLWFHTG
ncbi:MAG TPA: AMP-binding protein, partial [Ilumatobacteraceae bacterium]